jgi:hypothetical protein
MINYPEIQKLFGTPLTSIPKIPSCQPKMNVFLQSLIAALALYGVYKILESLFGNRYPYSYNLPNVSK